MYYGGGCCYPGVSGYAAPYGGAGYGYGGTSAFAIVLVLFILLVVVFGSRCVR